MTILLTVLVALMAVICIGSAVNMDGSTTVLPLGIQLAEAGGIDVYGEANEVLPPLSETLIDHDGLLHVVSPGTGVTYIIKEQIKGILRCLFK